MAGGSPLTPSTIIVQFTKTNLHTKLYKAKLFIKLQTRPFSNALKLIAYNFRLKLNRLYSKA